MWRYVFLIPGVEALPQVVPTPPLWVLQCMILRVDEVTMYKTMRTTAAAVELRHAQVNLHNCCCYVTPKRTHLLVRLEQVQQMVEQTEPSL